MIEKLVPSLSTFGGDIDNLFTFITIMVGFWFILTEGLIVYFLFRFNRKKNPKAQYITGDEKKEHHCISIPHYIVIACDVAIIVWTMMVWHNVKQKLPDADLTIRVIAQQWAWTFQQPGPDGVLDTEDDIKTVDQLHILAGKKYHYKLVAKDVLHNFSVPVFRLKQDAVPGREITGWFEAKGTGEHDIQCAEMCGIGHGLMGARIFIHDQAGYDQWMAGYSQNKQEIQVSQKGN